MALLRVEALKKHFHIDHLNRTIDVFDALSFELSEGEFLLVTGSNGTGKSSLLRCLYRTYIPTGGHAWFTSRRGEIDLARAADIDIAWLRRTEMGFITQFLRSRPRVSALEIVMEPLLDFGQSVVEAREQAESILDEFDLKPQVWAAYPTTFSGGEQQKVNLARALIAPRRLILLDEPTASLDISARRTLIARLERLKSQGVAMIGVFHHPEDAEHLVDRSITLQATAGTAVNGAILHADS
jgi:alpha-D-ribose 1-methylphosphonate 5-triphosphate synthase subunit PhnL